LSEGGTNRSFKNKKIVTEISPEAKWWTAEEYHQKYCALETCLVI
jgi:peptide methionine sulfoxide reductase MsrA